MAEGWISLHRKFTDWEWYDDINTMKLFIHCLLKANHKDKNWRGIQIEKGSFLTGRKQLALETRLSEQQIRTSLNKLKSTNEITIKTTNLYSLVSISNWNKYQSDNQQNTKPITKNQPTDNQQVTTTNNVNKENNYNKDIIEYLNLLSGKSFKHTTEKTKTLIKARCNEGFNLDNFKTVIDVKVKEWINTDMDKFIRPETLFGTKFESYLNSDKSHIIPQSNTLPSGVILIKPKPINKNMYD